MTGALYNGLLWLALPFAIARLLWRSRKVPGYRRAIGERLGFVPRLAQGPVIWVHAVSLGETRAAAPLVRWLRGAAPTATILLTHGTPTGREAGASLFGDAIRQCWLPWDLPFAVRRFLLRTQPALGLVMETEVWPNLLAGARRAGVPVYLVNARLSERSAARYHRARAFIGQALKRFSGVAAQSREDADRLRGLGADPVVVTGNLKFDLSMPSDLAARTGALRAWMGATRRVWVMGSTRDGEEALLIDAVRADSLPEDVLVVIVPRHPQRFDEVAGALARASEPVSRRTAGEPVPPAARFALGDTLGEMLAYYAAADVVFVGGSLLPHGGQNLIEACAVGRPVLVGPHTFNFAAATDEAIRRGAALRAPDAQALVDEASRLLADPARRAEMGQRAAQFAEDNRGAMARLAEWLGPALEATRARAPD